MNQIAKMDALTLAVRVATLEKRISALEDLIAPPDGPTARERHSIMMIVRDVAAEEGVSVADILGRGRRRRASWPRQEVMRRAHDEAGFSSTVIGMALGGRDHSTVLHGVEKARQRYEQHPRTGCPCSRLPGARP